MIFGMFFADECDELQEIIKLHNQADDLVKWFFLCLESLVWQ
jgi:hypothetical protein